jgi:hypothetical protein
MRQYVSAQPSNMPPRDRAPYVQSDCRYVDLDANNSPAFVFATPAAQERNP